MLQKKNFIKNIFSLEDEEQSRQKLQLERTQLEAKIKNLENLVATLQNELSKVKFFDLIFDTKTGRIYLGTKRTHCSL